MTGVSYIVVQLVTECYLSTIAVQLAIECYLSNIAIQPAMDAPGGYISLAECKSPRPFLVMQQFSKLYYVRRYKKLATKTWQDFYFAHYKRVKEDVAEVDATERDKVV